MTVNLPEGAKKGDRVAICEGCKSIVRRADLRYTNVKWATPDGQNYITYSSYNSSGWSYALGTGASNIGATSWGNHPWERYGYYVDNTATLMDGIQTWSGEVTFRSTSGVDASAQSGLVFSIQVGDYQESTTPGLTVVMGLCDSAGNNKQVCKTWSNIYSKKVWFYIAVADIASPLSSSAVYFYFTVTPTTSLSYWWWDEAQLEFGVTTPGNHFIPTTGASVTKSANTGYLGMAKLCPECVERIPDEEEDEPDTSQYGEEAIPTKMIIP